MNERSINSEAGGRCPRRFDRIDAVLVVLLVLSGGMLTGGLGWPTLVAWVNRPRPGVQGQTHFAAAARDGRLAVDLNYLLYLPKGYGRDNRDWPLVLFLHGAGERGTDVEKVARRGPPCLVAKGRAFPFVLVSPQCRPDRRWELDTLLRLIDHLATRYRVDADRVYVTGYSMGGIGTWGLAVAAPERFAATVPLSGGGDPAEAGRLKDLAIWAFHGGKDDVVPLAASERMVEAVRAAGGCAELTVYEEEGHDIAEMTYAKAELWDWLLAQRRKSDGRAVP